MQHPLRIAFYGKGGIGKSTTAANISVLLAKAGKKVLHIGCDPKADSTRILTHKRIPTVLQQLDAKDILSRSDIVFEGIYGICCVEAGGPEAGCGCAGLGITAAMNELKNAGIFNEHWDVIIYDVLGDVVCGGFSVPMRQNYVDKVYIITSANFMSLYAANNILKGIYHYSVTNNNLFGGLILNHTRTTEEMLTTQKFSACTKAQLIAKLPEEPLLQLADLQRKPFVTEYPTLKSTKILEDTVQYILQQHSLPMPVPMQQDELEAFAQQIAESIYHGNY